MNYAPETPLHETRLFDFTNAWSNSINADGGDPLTPVFLAAKGEKVRIRLLQPGGHQRNHVFALHGHSWQEFPYTYSQSTGLSIGNNPTSMVVGSQMGIGPSSHFDIVINGAGGKFGIVGDYLYRDQQSFMFDAGLWGLLRVR